MNPQKKEKDTLLKNCEENLHILFNLIDDLILFLDKDGKIIEISKSGSLHLDYPEDELKGKHFLELIDIKHKPSILKTLNDLLTSEELISTECGFISKYGREILFELTFKSIRKNGSLAGVLCAGNNISILRSYETEINQLKQRMIEFERLLTIERSRSAKQKAMLAELNTLKNEFISSISHELRTPLASIVGFSETIFSDPNMSDELKNEFNKIILNEGKRLAKLINDALDLSRIEQGKVPLEKIKFNIVETLKDSLKTVEPEINNKGIQLSIKLPEEEIILNGDKKQLGKVFTILLENAVKFTDSGGRISILAQDLGDEFEIIITDTGAGISKKDIHFLFEKPSGLGSSGNGIEFGLVFAKKVIDLHNGYITVQSELKKGSSFLLKFPKSL